MNPQARNPTSPPQGWPPDGGKSDEPSSFRDKLLGSHNKDPFARVDLLAENLIKVDYENGNMLLPKFHIEEKVVQELCAQWGDALIVKLMGRGIGYKALNEKLKVIWKLQGTMELVDLGFGYFLVRLSSLEDMTKVLNEGPWMVNDHYLTIRFWDPDFIPSKHEITKTGARVRFPELNMVYCNESVLLAFAASMGKPIKVDKSTLQASRGHFARVCVEIDLHKPLVGRFWLDDHWYKVEYEGLHEICMECGCYGHLANKCPSKMPNETVPANSMQGGTFLRCVPLAPLNKILQRRLLTI